MNKLKTDFLTKDNVELIWEIIIDDEGIRNIHDINNPNFKNFFISQIRGFNQLEGVQNLMQLNKMFITNIIDIATSARPKQEKINESVQKEREKEKELITYENIQSDRQTKFENDYKQKSFEFQDAIKLIVPPQVDFTEKKDIPITEMERLISETIAQRNFETNNIFKDIPPPTSVENKGHRQNQLQDTSKIKYIKIDKSDLNIKNEIIELHPKKVSWGENMEQEQEQYKEEQEQYKEEQDDKEIVSIFSKLKMIPIKKVENNIKNNNIEMLLLIEKMDLLNEKLNKILLHLSKD
jgi:hypothetical protein